MGHFLNANEEHRTSGIGFGYLARCLDAIHDWHAEVQYRKIRREELNLLDSLDAVDRFSTYSPVRMPSRSLRNRMRIVESSSANNIRIATLLSRVRKEPYALHVTMDGTLTSQQQYGINLGGD
jgi:hypothetical protein